MCLGKSGHHVFMAVFCRMRIVVSFRRNFLEGASMPHRNITGQADECLRFAKATRKHAKREPHLARQLLAIAERWEMLAESFRAAEQISAYLDWQAETVRLHPGAYRQAAE
jgi:hypothetical protein